MTKLSPFLEQGQTPTIWTFEDRMGRLTKWAHATKDQWDRAGERSREIFKMQNGGIRFAIRIGSVQ